LPVTLAAIFKQGGPALVAGATTAAHLDPAHVYKLFAHDEHNLQAMLEATAGTPFGARLQNVMAAAGRLGKKADSDDGRVFLDAAAKEPIGDDWAKAPPKNADERRGRSLQRNLAIPGTGKVVAATLMEAYRDHGAAGMHAALAAAGTSL